MGAFFDQKPGTTSYIYFSAIHHIKSKYITGGYYYGLQDYAEDIGLPRSTGGAQNDLARKSILRQKNGGFFGSSYRHIKGSMVACNRRKDRDRQITNGVGSDDTAVIPRDIIHFFEEDDKYGS